MKLRTILEKYEGVYSDTQIITEYFTQNNMEYEAMDLLISLAKKRAKKVESELDYVKSWLPVKIDMKDVCKDMRVGNKLDKLITCQICGFEPHTDLLEWARENIPNMELPQLMFMDTVKWLKEKYGIRFKDGEKYGY